MSQQTTRRRDGNETWFRLREWTKGQTPAERLAGHILRAEGFNSIDPSHPLGGKDGLKDIICDRDGKKWIGAAYFPRGQQSLKIIRDKFLDDLKGVAANRVEGMAFVTNQELTLGERKKLKGSAGEVEIEIFHLERITSILDSPKCYGIRLEFLDIEVSKEELSALIADNENLMKEVKAIAERTLALLENPERVRVEDKGETLKILKAFRFLLDESNINASHYEYLVKDYFETLDRGIPILISSNTFADFIEKVTGTKPQVREFPREWEVDWGLYTHHCQAVASGDSKTDEDRLIDYAIAQDRHIELNQAALDVFNSTHESLLIAINSSDY